MSNEKRRLGNITKCMSAIHDASGEMTLVVVEWDGSKLQFAARLAPNDDLNCPLYCPQPDENGDLPRSIGYGDTMIDALEALDKVCEIKEGSC